LIERDGGPCGGPQLGDQLRLHHGERLSIGSIEELDQADDAWLPEGCGPLREVGRDLDGREEPAVEDESAAFDVELAVRSCGVTESAVQA
jgi:hypothetical protein